MVVLQDVDATMVGTKIVHLFFPDGRPDIFADEFEHVEYRAVRWPEGT